MATEIVASGSGVGEAGALHGHSTKLAKYASQVAGQHSARSIHSSIEERDNKVAAQAHMRSMLCWNQHRLIQPQSYT